MLNVHSRLLWVSLYHIKTLDSQLSIDKFRYKRRIGSRIRSRLTKFRFWKFGHGLPIFMFLKLRNILYESVTRKRNRSRRPAEHIRMSLFWFQMILLFLKWLFLFCGGKGREARITLNQKENLKTTLRFDWLRNF